MQVTVDSSTADAKMPQGRYFHGADIVYTKQTIYIYGGLTKPTKSLKERTLDDFWQFDIQNQRWSEIEKNPNWPPTMSAHTLTSYRNSSGESLILIGGVSPLGEISSLVWEFRLDKEQWVEWSTRGQAPKGIFGHSTVFHFQSNSLYVFGGYTYDQQSKLSNKLFMLNYESKVWMELNELGASLYLVRENMILLKNQFMFLASSTLLSFGC